MPPADKLGLIAEDERTHLKSVLIPMDDNRNHAADAWEEGKGLGDLAADWDEEKVPGQEAAGDGLTLYREYRGFMVLENGKPTFKRLSPAEKELFIIDAAGSLNSGIWQNAAQITPYRLDDTMIKGGDDPSTSRIVDFNTGEMPRIYAVRLETIRGKADTYPTDDPNPSVMGYCEGPCNSPKTAIHVCILPDRMRDTVKELAAALEKALNDPGSPRAQQLKDKDIPVWLAHRALEQFGEGTIDALVRQMTTVASIHELGHACSVPGHTPRQPDNSEPEGPWGDVTCFMRYPDQGNQWDLSVLQVLFGRDRAMDLQYDKFCREGEYRCFSHLNVKD